MAWFRLDDKGAFHAKVLLAGNEAYGAWCRAGQWSSHHLTNGFVPFQVANTIAGSRLWTRCVESGLMEVRETGYQIHDYLDWNPSKDDILSKREKRAEAGRKGGIQGQATLQEKRYRDKQTSKQLLDPLLDGLLRTCPSHVDDMDQVKANPIPIPICSPTENNLVSGGPPPKPKRERKHRYPESTVPYSDASDGDIKAWCLKWGIPFEHAEFAHFLGHHRRKESHYRDWLASWDTWLKTGEKFAKERGSGVRIVQQEPANGPLWKVPEAI